MLRTLSTVGLGLAAVTALAWPCAIVLDSAVGGDYVIVLNPTAPEDLKFKQAEFELDYDGEDPADPEYREAVISVYGSNPNKTIETDRILFADASRVIRPAEIPDGAEPLLLLPRTDDYYPVQSLSLLFNARMASIGAVIAFVVLLLARRMIGGRQDPAAARAA